MDDDTDQSLPVRLGPRQKELLDGWKETVQSSPSGLGYDFTAPPPREGLTTQLDAFADAPSTDAFSAVWETLERTTTPYAYVLGQWPEDINALADFLQVVRQADSWNTDWTDRIRSQTWLYELFTRTHETYPVVDTQTQNFLRRFGIRVDDTFESHLDGMETLRSLYAETLGSATAGTEYEASLTRELDELFSLLYHFSPDDIVPRLLGRDKPVYEPLIGFEATTHDGGRIELDIDIVETLIREYTAGVNAGAYGINETLTDAEREQYWCGQYDEEWKHKAAGAVSTALFEELDGTALDSDELERVLDVYDEGHGVISGPVIEYLLGPQQGWRVWDAFKEHTRKNPEVAAAVLSRFFDPDAAYITGRLELFRWYYDDNDTLTAGSLMKLATGLLMLAMPERYVMYQYSRCAAFFEDVDVSGFDVTTGYNPDEYHQINAAADRLRARIDPHLNRSATMCDIQSIFYFWKDEPLL